MFIVDASIFKFDLQTEEVYKYLFHAPWRKSVIDTGYHNYGGFTNLLKTDDGKVFNTGNYCIGNSNSHALDEQLGSFLNCFVESHYISILPKCRVGEHYDIYDADDETVNATANDFINTSILYPIFGNIEVTANGVTQVLKPGVFTIIDTSKLHDGLNIDKSLSWCLSSLCYNVKYTDVKKAFSNYILEDLDE
jgi:glyoxylate utilization-related uncharacterized protein